MIFREYPLRDESDMPYYPVNTPQNNALVDKYLKCRRELPNVLLGGRLADYKYYDMDRAMEKALELYEDQVDRWVPGI